MGNEKEYVNPLNADFRLFCRLEAIGTLLMIVYLGIRYPDITIPDYVLEYVSMSTAGLLMLGLFIPLTVSLLIFWYKSGTFDLPHDYVFYLEALLLLIPNFIGLICMHFTSMDQFVPYLLVTFVPLAIYTVLYIRDCTVWDSRSAGSPDTPEDMKRAADKGFGLIRAEIMRRYDYDTDENYKVPREVPTGKYGIEETDGGLRVTPYTKTVYDEHTRRVHKSGASSQWKEFGSVEELLVYLSGLDLGNSRDGSHYIGSIRMLNLKGSTIYGSDALCETLLRMARARQ